MEKEQSAPASTPTTQHAFIGKKIFIAEDDSFIGGMIHTHILEEGMIASLFTTGEKALEAMRTDIPDLVILDILLPGLNGIEVLERMRKDERTKDVPVLVVSNVNQVQDQEKVKKLNADFILKALINPEQIVVRIREKMVAEWKKTHPEM